MSNLKKKALILIVPIILVALAISPQAVRPVHAVQHTGLICLADPTAAALTPANPCPATPWVFNGPNATRPQQLSVGIYAHVSGNMSSFAIILLANHTVVRPSSVDFSRTILPGTPTVVRECIAGIHFSGAPCNPVTDTSDTIDLAVQGGFGQIANYPVTGLLFVAIYNITQVNVAPSIPLTFQTGCGTTTSVSGGTCITIGNGTTTAVPETAQAATFTNNTPPPYVTTSASTSRLTSTSGDSRSDLITATGQNGWPTGQGVNPRISFTAVTTGAGLTAGMTATFSPTFCSTSGSPSTCTSVLSVSFLNPGNFSVTVFGNYAAKATAGLSSGKTSTLGAPVTLIVSVYNFNITSIPNSVSMLTGGTGGSNITITFGSAFAGTVNLANPVISPSSGLSCSLAPTTFMVTGNSTLQCSGTGGIYKVQVSANDGTSTLATNVTFSVQAFVLSASPSSLTVLAGNSGSSTITVTRSTGFTGAVALTDTVTPSTGVVCSQTPPLVPSTSTISSLMCSTTTPGTYNVNVNGTSAGVPSVAINIPLTVLAFNLSATPASVNVLVGLKGNSTITVTAGAGFTGLVTLTDSSTSCSQTPSSVTFGTSPQTSTLSCIFSATGNNVITVTGNHTGVPNVSVTVNYSVQDFTIVVGSPTVLVGQQGTSTIMVTAVNGFTGTVSLSDTPPAGLTCNPISPTSIMGSGTASVACSGAAAISYMLPITGAVGTFTHSGTAIFTVVDFTISASSPSAALVGVSAMSTITVTAVNGFTGTVSLTDNPPTGLTCGIISPIFISGAGTATVSCSGAAATSYTLPITGAVGSFTHGANAGFTFVDFTLTASPSSVTVNAGVSASSTITVSAVNGFTGTVALSTTSTPSGLSCSVTPASIPTSGTSTLSCQGSYGSYTVTVIGTSGGVSRNSNAVSYTVQDFSISVNPTTVSFDTSSSGTSTITITALSGFSGTVTVTPSSSDPALTATVSPGSVSGSGTMTLTLSSSTANSYTVTITGASGSVSHSTTVSVTVTSPSNTSTIFGIPANYFYAIIGVIVAAIIVGTLLVLRRRRPSAGGQPSTTPANPSGKKPAGPTK